jgi:hypothetical protein
MLRVCLNCGCDLRDSDERCPECGSKVNWDQAWAADRVMTVVRSLRRLRRLHLLGIWLLVGALPGFAMTYSFSLGLHLLMALLCSGAGVCIATVVWAAVLLGKARDGAGFARVLDNAGPDVRVRFADARRRAIAAVCVGVSLLLLMIGRFWSLLRGQFSGLL